MSSRIAFQGLPKQLSKQLNQIKRDKEQEDKLHSNSKADKVGKLQSDIISKYERGGNSSDEEEKTQRWEKVKLPGITKAIRKVNVKREQLADQDGNADGQWTKNCDVSDSFSYDNSTTNKSSEDGRPKKKITINRDNKGRAHFKEEIIDEESAKNKQSSRSLVVKRPVIYLKNRKPQQQDDDEQMEEENDSKSEYSRSDNGNQDDDDDDDAEYERRRNNKKQSNYDNEDDDDRYDQDSLDQEYEAAQQKQHETSRGKCGYLEVSNLPRQIDNIFLKDLLKREKDHLIESYKTDTKGRVKLDSREAAERSISILNKRTLYGQTIQAYIINEAQFNRSSGTTKSKIPVIQRITTKRSK